MEAIMKKFLDSFNKWSNNVFDNFNKFFRKHLLLIVFIVLSLIALAMRILFIDYLSGDMASFLVPWFNYFRENGHFLALKTIDQATNNDYLLGYNNLLALMSYFGGRPIAIIKSISFFFDFALAIGVGLVTYHFSKKKITFLISYLIVLFAPSVFANSALWGQCDQIYVCLVVYTFLLFLKKKNILGSLLLGIAFSFKIQTIFFVPLLGFMWLNKKYRLWYLLLIPVGFMISALPCYFVGGEFVKPFTIIGKQFGEYSNLNYGAGSMYAFLEMTLLAECFNKGVSILFALAVLLFIMFVLYYKKVECNENNMLYVAALYAIITPFVLPHMHERYFFMADMFILMYVIVRKKQYYLAPLMIFSSVNNYTHFLTGEYIFKFLGQDCVRLSALINLAIIIILLVNMRELFPKKEQELIDNN